MHDVNWAVQYVDKYRLFRLNSSPGLKDFYLHEDHLRRENHHVFPTNLDHLCLLPWISLWFPHMDVSKNRGTPKWMVKIMENPIKMDDLGGVKNPIFGSTPISHCILPRLCHRLFLPSPEAPATALCCLPPSGMVETWISHMLPIKSSFCKWHHNEGY